MVLCPSSFGLLLLTFGIHFAKESDSKIARYLFIWFSIRISSYCLSSSASLLVASVPSFDVIYRHKHVQSLRPKTSINKLRYHQTPFPALRALPSPRCLLLCRGIVFKGGVVGKALKGPICTYEFSGAVNMDHSKQVSFRYAVSVSWNVEYSAAGSYVQRSTTVLLSKDVSEKLRDAQYVCILVVMAVMV